MYSSLFWYIQIIIFVCNPVQMNAQNFGYDHLSTQSFDYMKNINEKNLSLSEHVSIMNIFCHFSILIELAGTYILLELGSKSTYQISTNF